MRPFVIAELGSNWLSDSLTPEAALKEAAYDVHAAGANALKVQVLKRDWLYATARNGMKHEQDKLAEVRQGLEGLDFDPDWLPALQRTCHILGIELWASVFNPGYVDDCANYLDGLKIASGDLVYEPMHRAVVKAAERRGIPVALSTGAATWNEVKSALSFYTLHNCKADIVLMHCVSAYPADSLTLNLDTIAAYLENFSQSSVRLDVGFSDHTMSNNAALVALGLGAEYFEVHFKIRDTSEKAPDFYVGRTLDQLRDYVAALGDAYEMIGQPRGERVNACEVDERVWARRGKDGLRPKLQAD